MWSAVIFALILSFLVWIHELGHYVAARWAKIKVEEFGLGYPPRALRLFRKWGTDFTLNWFPFGGFVRMEGEDDHQSTSLVYSRSSDGTFSRSFAHKSAWQRLVVVLAGAATNFLFGVVAFSIVFSVIGIPHPIPEARIGAIQPNTPAAAANLPSQVNVIAVRTAAGQTIATPTIEALVASVADLRGQTVTLVTTGPCQDIGCQESAQEFAVYVRTAVETPANEGAMGIVFQPVVFVFAPWYERPFRGAVYGTIQALGLGGEIIKGLGSLVINLVTKAEVPADLTGPVGIVHQAQQNNIFQQGFWSLLSFAGMLSINLGVMNVLPIPALDGGRALFIGLEKIVGRHRLSKVEDYAHYGGYIFLVAVIVLVTARDILRLFT